MMKGTWLLGSVQAPHSSQTIIIIECCVVQAGDLRIGGTLAASHLSPVETEQSCMSSHTLGVMNA